MRISRAERGLTGKGMATRFHRASRSGMFWVGWAAAMRTSSPAGRRYLRIIRPMLPQPAAGTPRSTATHDPQELFQSGIAGGLVEVQAGEIALPPEYIVQQAAGLYQVAYHANLTDR